MKKITFIFLAFISIHASAETIQNQFLGFTLGKSTRPKVEKIMQRQKFQLVGQDSIRTLYYEGKFLYAGLEFKNITLEFTNDTLNYFSFSNDFGYKNYESSKLLRKNLSDKYSQLEIADSTFFATIHRNGFEEDVETWSRRGDGLIVLLFTTDTYTKCVFAIEPAYAISYDKATQHLKLLAASYDSINEVKGFGGINFGDDMNKARSILKSKSSEVMTSTSGNELIGYQTTIGGITYKYAYFTFHNSKGFIKALAFKEYDSRERQYAELQFNALLKQYGARYTNLTMHKDEEDDKMYSCGMYSSDYDWPPIFIIFIKDTDSETFKVKYQVAVSYYTHKKEYDNTNEI